MTTGIVPRVAPMFGIRSVMPTKSESGAAYGSPSSFIDTKVVRPAMTPIRNLPYQ